MGNYDVESFGLGGRQSHQRPRTLGPIEALKASEINKGSHGQTIPMRLSRPAKAIEAVKANKAFDITGSQGL